MVGAYSYKQLLYVPIGWTLQASRLTNTSIFGHR
ncbi:hypothetical protein FOXYSP1_19339 [Fusarium oxysporum f. sp. phaseoli]